MLNKLITELCDYSAVNRLIYEHDKTYCINRLLHLLHADCYEKQPYQPHENIESLLNDILDYAVSHDVLQENTITFRDILSADIMNCFTPFPSQIIDKYLFLYNENPKLATDYFYSFSKNTNYIMTERVKKDIKWKTSTPYGEIDITINLSKPEKDPKDIAAAKSVVSTGYPKCLLCYENEGFEGNANHPPRSNHRIIPMDLAGESWFLQYSPYVYYNEHCIILNSSHTPMQINHNTFVKLLAFVEKLPHYFIGSNADLPIVGGSILSHDHFQGGNYDFAMALCKARTDLTFTGYEDIKAVVVDWALSTIRLVSTDTKKLADLANKILTTWRGYSDINNEILSYTDENGTATPHNTITPIARFRDGNYELDLILRNNRTSKEHPLGIFHPHAKYHNIKKENIGLIEAMGLAVLPARLKTELSYLANALTDEAAEKNLIADESMRHHLFFYTQLKVFFDKSVDTDALVFVQKQVGTVFTKILDNCGVFKNTKKGNCGFAQFVEFVNQN